MKTRCSDCAWFCPDHINPGVGMGKCMHAAEHGYWHALAQHYCRDHEPAEPAEDDK